MVKKWQINENKAWFKKWWPEKAPYNYEFEEIPLGDYFERQRKKYSKENFMWFLESFMTYEEAGRAMDSLATALSNLGLKKGDACALLMPNSFQYIISFYACIKIGAIPSGIDPTYKPLEVLYQIETTNSKGIIVLDALYGELVKPIIDETNIEFIVYTNIADLASGLSSITKFIGKLIVKIQKE